MIKYLDESDVREKGVGSQFKGAVRHVREARELEAAGHTALTIRKQRDGCIEPLLSSFPLNDPGSQPGTGATHSGQVFAPQLIQSR